MKSSDKSSLFGVLLVEHFGRDAATPVGHARGRCCLSRIHSITHHVGETVPHARVLANIRAGGWCSSCLAKLGWKSQKVDASPEARGATRLRAEHHRARNQRLRYLASRRPAGQCGRCGSDVHAMGESVVYTSAELNSRQGGAIQATDVVCWRVG